MAKTDNFEDFLVDLANTIRKKKGTADLINPQDFSQEIESIGGGDHYYKILNGDMASQLFGGSGTSDFPGICQINSAILDGYMINTVSQNIDRTLAKASHISDILEKCTALSISDSPNTIAKFSPNWDGYDIIKIPEGDLRQKIIYVSLGYLPEEEINGMLGELDVMLSMIVQKISKDEYEALITN